MTTSPMAAAVKIDVQQTPSRDQAQQMAASELANPKYHNQPAPQQGSVTSLPTIGAPTTASSPTPTPPPTSTSTSGSNVILVILGAVALVLILVFVLRAIGKPRKKKDKDKKPDKPKRTGDDSTPPAFDEVLVGAALHRRDAQNAADAGRWADAIRERFRAVISTLDERGLLPERPERTADEAARDAGEVLPEHRQPLSAAALAFDEVEYGEYVGNAEGYARIREVDEQIIARAAAGRTGSRR